MPTVNQGNVASSGTLLQNYLFKKTLDNFESELYFAKMGEKPMVSEGYSTVSWTKPSKLTRTAAETTLTEGVTPASAAFTFATISATPVQYGLYVEVSDLLMNVAPVDVLGKAAIEVRNNLARIIDQVIQTEVMAGTNVLYGGTATARANITATDKMTASVLNKSAIKLKSLDAPQFDGYFVAVAHPLVAGDLKAESNGAWIEFSKYTTPEKLFKGEIGALYGVRIVESSNVQTFASTVTVYPTLVMGKGAYGVADFSAAEVLYSPLGASKSDPLAQRATVGAKVFFAAKRLQENALVRIESAATAV
jgi:N4-gp56 family major capsid protein